MQEIEVKILEIDVPALVKKLEELGARKESDERISTILFKSKGSILRLRKKGDDAEFCLKRPIGDGAVKAMEETEVVVSDFDAMRKILGALGFKEKHHIEKQRISYALDGVHYELDTIHSPVECPTFLEIEAHDEAQLREAVERIGFTMADTVTYGQIEVLDHYSR